VGLPEAESALLDYAERVTVSPHACSKTDITGLREAGWNDATIHDAVQVIAYFNYINRVADALGVELEEDALDWGVPRD
jgi:uncharacterized peroxidase-related enzyme